MDVALGGAVVFVIARILLDAVRQSVHTGFVSVTRCMYCTVARVTPGAQGRVAFTVSFR
jgi:hypothetical protein